MTAEKVQIKKSIPGILTFPQPLNKKERAIAEEKYQKWIANSEAK